MVAIEAHQTSLMVFDDLAHDPGVLFYEHHVAIQICYSCLYKICFAEQNLRTI